MPTTLVLLPGLDGTGVLFERFVDALPPSITPIVFSYPGDVPMSYPELLTLIKTKIPDEPFAVLGESFSGPLALDLAVDEERVKAVILCATFVTRPVPYVPRAAAKFAYPFWFSFFPAFARAKALLAGYSTPQLRALLRRAHKLVTPSVIASRAQSILRLDAREALRRCPVPIMYLAGATDGVVRRHNPALIKDLRNDVELVFIPGPHLVLQTSPEAAAVEVEKFLARVVSQ